MQGGCVVPSAWIERWAGLIPNPGRVLDVACGAGRHALYLAGLGYQVDAVDLAPRPPEAQGEAGSRVNWLRHDLENAPWPFADGAYQGVVVSNYLHRPLFPRLIDALAPDGVLIYATFAVGQERLARPRNPAYLLMAGELLEVVRGRMRVVAYEDVLETGSQPARVQRLCAIKN